MQVLDFQKLVGAVQARHLAISLADAYRLAPETPAAVAAAQMREYQYDYAPVMDGDEVLGLFGINSAHQNGTVLEQAEPIVTSLLVSADTPLSQLVQLLCDTELLLVLEGHRLTGLVTRTDLGSAAARTHFYLLLASAEILLAECVRRQYPDQDEAVRKLSKRRQDRYQETAAQLHESDSFIDQAASMSFADLVHIMGENAAFRKIARQHADRGWQWIVHGLAPFRDDIMHPARDIASLPGFDVKRLAKAEIQIAALSHAAAETLRVADG